MLRRRRENYQRKPAIETKRFDFYEFWCPMQIILPTAADTARLGAALSDRIEAGDVLALWGDLGAGKSTLARGLIQAFVGEAITVPSPTFTLVQTYDRAGLQLWHFDFYRLERPEEVWELGLEEALESGISVIEWPERVGNLLPGDRLDLRLLPARGDADPSGEGEGRIASLAAGPSWTARLEGFSHG